METKMLTPKTKELIYHKIKECEQEMRMIRKAIDKIPEDDTTYEGKDFVQMWWLEIEFLEKQIEHWKQLLFNN
jgi:hypothetical protein